MPVFVSAIFTGAVVGARQAGLLQSPELAAYDVLLRLRDVAEGAPEVAVIAVGDDALDAWGWPVPDGDLARLIAIAEEAGAAAIALDIYRDRPVGEGHDELAQRLASAPVIGAMKFASDAGAAVEPPAALKAAGRYGVVDVPVDDDGVLRRSLLYVDDGVSVHPGLALSSALYFLRSQGIRPGADPDDPTRMRLGAATLSRATPGAAAYQNMDAGGYQILLDFRRRDGDVATVSALGLVEGETDPTVLEGKIVFVGIASELVKDLVVTPRPGNTPSGLLNGVVVHAWLADQLVRLARGESRLLDYPEPAGETLIVVAAGAAGLVVGLWISSALGLAVAGLAIAATCLVGSFVLFAADFWVPVVPGTVAALGSLAIAVGGRAASERRERRALMRLFSQQVSPQIAEDLWNRRDVVLDRGLPRPLRLTASVMFVDLAGSTSIADRLDPDLYMGWVGRFLERMADTALGGGGLVDKYTGDGLMVVFGVPLPRTEPRQIDADAAAAVRTALAMARALERFNADENLPDGVKARMRIGIHTGVVFAGCVGARERAQVHGHGGTGQRGCAAGGA